MLATLALLLPGVHGGIDLLSEYERLMSEDTAYPDTYEIYLVSFDAALTNGTDDRFDGAVNYQALLPLHKRITAQEQLQRIWNAIQQIVVGIVFWRPTPIRWSFRTHPT